MYFINTVLNNKVNALTRYTLVHLFSGVFPLYIVNEYPKSGGTWLGQMLAESLDIPFPRNKFPPFRPCIMHGHYLNPWGMKNVVILWRDGRDVMVSWYYHCLLKNEQFNKRLVNIVRSDLEFDDYNDIHANLPAFIEYSFTRQRHPRYSWSDFVNSWHGRNDVVYSSYERLVKNTPDELSRIIFDLCNKKLSNDLCKNIAEKYSFKKQTGREPGEEDKSSFIRKGIAGDWVNYFSNDARMVFNKYAGSELIKLGYEKDNSWINKSVKSY